MTRRIPAAMVTTVFALLLCTAAPAGAQTPTVCDGLEQALSLFNAGKRDEAYPALRDLSARKCNQPIVYVFQGAYERGKGQTEEAANTFRLGLTHDAANITLLLELAVTYSWTNRLPDSLATYRSVLLLDNTSKAARLGVARVLGWMGRRGEAMAGFEAVLDETPDNIEALLGLAAVQLAALKPDAARANYTRVLALATDNREAREGLERVDAFTRVNVSATAVANLMGGQRVQALGLMASYRVTPELRMTAGLNTIALDPLAEEFGYTSRTAPVPASMEQRLGVDWRINNRTSVAAAVKTQKVRGRTVASGSIDASRTLSSRLSLGGGVRSISGTDGTTVLSSGGLSFTATKVATLAVQGYFGMSPTGTSRTLANTLRVALWRGGSASGTVAIGQQAGSTFLTMSGSAAARLSSAADLRIDGTWYRGRYRSVRVAGTLTVRF